MLEELAARPAGTAPMTPAVKARARRGAGTRRGAVFPRPAFRAARTAKSSSWMRACHDGKAKNISLDHTSGKLQATSLTGERGRRAGGDDGTFRRQRRALVARPVALSRASNAPAPAIRPVQVEGRRYSKISDDRLLHIDAFPVASDARGGASCASSPMSRRPSSAPLACGRAVRGFRARLPAARRPASCPASPGCTTSWASPAAGAACMTS